MRTLKKTLSLVLVLVMAVGLFAINAAAFTDDEEVQYKEAVAVMTGIGAINGYEDGSFRPNGEITRAEAAKMLTYAILGPSVANKLPARTSSFKDMQGYGWATPYIEYLVSKGIINGVGNDKFEPGGNVTGYQLAKMILAAAGYGKAGEYVGSSWAINVSIDGFREGLFNGVDADFNNPATREEAAALIFNGLTVVDTVTYSKDKEAYDKVQTAVGATERFNADGYVQIAENVYPTLERTTGADSFGRPSVNTWTLGGKKIAEVNTQPAAVVYTSAVTTGKIYSDLKLKSGTTGTKVLGANVYTNGVAGITGTDDVVIALNDRTTIGGNGVITEVYTDNQGNPTTIVFVKPTFGKVTNVTTGKESNGSTFVKYTVGTGTSFGTATDYKVYTNALNNETDQAVINGSVAKGDYVTIYTVSDTAYITPATLVTGKLTSYSSATGLYTIEGKTYALSAVTGAAAPGSSDYNKPAAFAVDSYGYLIGTVTVPTADNYLYVLKSEVVNVLEGTVIKSSVVADVALADGTTAKVTVAKVGATPVTSAVSTGMYTYKVNAKGAYELTSVTAATNATLSPKNPLIASGVYANNVTKFVIANWTKDETNTPVVDGTVNIVTGYANLSEMSSVVGSYIDADGNNVAEVVFIYSKAGVATAINYVYYLGTFSTDGTKFSYDFVVNGQKTTLDDVTGLTNAGLYSIDDTNAATPVDFTTDKELNIAAAPNGVDGIYKNKALSFDNGLLKVEDTVKAAAAGTVPVYVFDGPTFEVKTLADFDSPVTGNIVIAQNGVAVTAISVVK